MKFNQQPTMYSGSIRGVNKFRKNVFEAESKFCNMFKSIFWDPLLALSTPLGIIVIYLIAYIELTASRSILTTNLKHIPKNKRSS